MGKMIKVRCTGAGQHENEIDIDSVLGTDVVRGGSPIDTGRPIPQQIVQIQNPNYRNSKEFRTSESLICKDNKYCFMKVHEIHGEWKCQKS